MGSDWHAVRSLADDFEDYDDLPERTIGYPAVFDALGLGSPGVCTLLDFGCGPGKVARRVVDRFDGVDVLAVDVSERMLQIARGRRAHPRIRYAHVTDAALDGVPDGSVDAAMACYVFINVGDPAVLRSIAAGVHRVLRPGGRFALLDTNPGTTGVRFSTFRSGEPGRAYTAGESRSVALDLPGGRTMDIADHHWPRPVYRDVLHRAGFARVTTEEPLLADAGADPDTLARFRPGGAPAAEDTGPPFLIVTGVK